MISTIGISNPMGSMEIMNIKTNQTQRNFSLPLKYGFPGMAYVNRYADRYLAPNSSYSYRATPRPGETDLAPGTDQRAGRRASSGSARSEVRDTVGSVSPRRATDPALRERANNNFNLRSILKRFPSLSRKRVAFGPVSVKPIPNRREFDAMAAPPEPQPSAQLPVFVSPIYGRKIGTVGMSTGLLILGDPEEFYEFFKQYPTWQECQAALTSENYQWTGSPNNSGLIIRDSVARTSPFRLYVKADPNNDTREIHLF